MELQELQRENAKECARLGVITFDEAIEVFKAIRSKNDAIIKELYARRADKDRLRASKHSGA